MNFCCHLDAQCLDHGIQCGECDKDGYPVNARRRLKRISEDTVEDIDDKQRFRIKKTKKGEQLLPIFKQVNWSSVNGFATILLILSCLGAEGEYILWDDSTNTKMDEDGWVKKKYGCKSILPIIHRHCGDRNNSTVLSSLTQGTHVGCKCYSTKENHWRYRRSEVVEWGKKRDFEVLTSEEEWIKNCKNAKWSPELKCNKCYEKVKCRVNNLERHALGCKCWRQEWRDRRPEVVAWGKERGFRVKTSADDWVANCTGAHWKPTLECVECEEIVTTTQLAGLQQNQIGCRCHSNHAINWGHRHGEMVEIADNYNFDIVTTHDEWFRNCKNIKYRPTVRCRQCKEEHSNATINQIQKEGPTCGRCNQQSYSHTWYNRRLEFVELGKKLNFIVLTGDEEWCNNCTGAEWCPLIQCCKCKYIVDDQSIHLITKKGNKSIACRCRTKHLWCFRREEIVVIGRERNFKVITTENEWKDQCYGCTWCPKLQCLTCNNIVNTTRLGDLQSGHSIGCNCRNKTEYKLHNWLLQVLPGVKINWGHYKGPTQKGNTNCTHFDFHLTFVNGFELIIELDGQQHFYESRRFVVKNYSEHFVDACKRDLMKEKWAIKKGLSVVRVLQEDVWNDRHDWQGWLIKSIADARIDEPQVYTPDAPEYRSSESSYVQTHMIFGI